MIDGLLQDLLDFNINFALSEMRAGKVVHPMATLVPEKEGAEFAVFQNASGLNAEQMRKAILTKIAEEGIKGVAFVSEAWFTQVTSPEALHRLDKGERFGSEEIVKRGWGKKRETLICSVETRTELHIVYQFFRRNSHGHVILEDLQQEMNVSGSDFEKRTGIFCFFDHAGHERVH